MVSQKLVDDVTDDTILGELQTIEKWHPGEWTKFQTIMSLTARRCRQLEALGRFVITPAYQPKSVWAALWRLIDRGLIQVEVEDRPDSDYSRRSYIVSARALPGTGRVPDSLCLDQMSRAEMRRLKTHRVEKRRKSPSV